MNYGALALLAMVLALMALGLVVVMLGGPL